MGMNAAVGPPICTRLPPSADTMNPATTAVNRPIAGGVSQGEMRCKSSATFCGMLAMPSAIANGRAITATVTPAVRSPKKRRSVIPSFMHTRDLGVKAFSRLDLFIWPAFYYF